MSMAAATKQATRSAQGMDNHTPFTPMYWGRMMSMGMRKMSCRVSDRKRVEHHDDAHALDCDVDELFIRGEGADAPFRDDFAHEESGGGD